MIKTVNRLATFFYAWTFSRHWPGPTTTTGIIKGFAMSFHALFAACSLVTWHSIRTASSSTLFGPWTMCGMASIVFDSWWFGLMVSRHGFKLLDPVRRGTTIAFCVFWIAFALYRILVMLFVCVLLCSLPRLPHEARSDLFSGRGRCPDDSFHLIDQDSETITPTPSTSGPTASSASMVSCSSSTAPLVHPAAAGPYTHSYQYPYPYPHAFVGAKVATLRSLAKRLTVRRPRYGAGGGRFNRLEEQVDDEEEEVGEDKSGAGAGVGQAKGLRDKTRAAGGVRPSWRFWRRSPSIRHQSAAGSILTSESGTGVPLIRVSQPREEETDGNSLRAGLRDEQASPVLLFDAGAAAGERGPFDTPATATGACSPVRRETSFRDTSSSSSSEEEEEDEDEAQRAYEARRRERRGARGG